MTTPTEEESLQLSVSNFGPIAKAEIDLRPLTVFVGPSNTGKSYLAILIYALQQFFGRYDGRRYRRRYPPFFIEGIKENQIVDYDNGNRLADWITNDFARREVKADSLVQVPDFIASIIQPLFHYLIDFSEVIGGEIRQSLGIADPARLIRYGNKDGAKIALRFKPFKYELVHCQTIFAIFMLLCYHWIPIYLLVQIQLTLMEWSIQCVSKNIK